MIASELFHNHVAVTDDNLGVLVEEIFRADKVIQPQAFVWAPIAGTLGPVRVVAFCIGMKPAKGIDESAFKLSGERFTFLSICNSRVPVDSSIVRVLQIK